MVKMQKFVRFVYCMSIGDLFADPVVYTLFQLLPPLSRVFIRPPSSLPHFRGSVLDHKCRDYVLVTVLNFAVWSCNITPNQHQVCPPLQSGISEIGRSSCSIAKVPSCEL